MPHKYRRDGDEIIVPFAWDEVRKKEHGIAFFEWYFYIRNWWQLWERISDDNGSAVDECFDIPFQRIAENYGRVRRSQQPAHEVIPNSSSLGEGRESHRM